MLLCFPPLGGQGKQELIAGINLRWVFGLAHPAATFSHPEIQEYQNLPALGVGFGFAASPVTQTAGPAVP